MNCPWIVCHDGTGGDLAYALECLRCGNIQRVATPISIDCWVAMGKAYAKQHRHCKAKGEEAKG